MRQIMTMRFHLSVLLVFILSALTLEAVESVRVNVRDGVPQILVDGEPVRPRMFYGGPGARPIEIGTEPQRMSFEFDPVLSEPKTATMHFRFGRKPLTILFDDILVEEFDQDGKTKLRDVVGPCTFENGMADFDKNWDHWPRGAGNTTGHISVQPKSGVDGSAALAVKLAAPKNGVWPDFHFFHHRNLSIDKDKRYRISFWVKSDTPTELAVSFYRPGASYIPLGSVGEDFFHKQVEMAGKAGARFVTFPVAVPWPKPGEEVDWTDVDEACQRVLKANPEALLVPRIQMNAPNWWLDANPGHVIKWIGTPSSSTGQRVAAVASKFYRQEAVKRLGELVRHLEEKFGPSMGGYHPAGQNSNEWFYQDSWGPAYNGYSKADESAWREWLAQRYKNDAALQKSWGNESVTLATAVVPGVDLRQSTSGGAFRDIAVEKSQQSVLDFVRFQQNMMADTVLALANVARQASKEKRMVVFFYGYTFEFASLRTSPATSGHYAMRKILDSPDIDLLCSPISYFDRQLGGSGAAMTTAESVALAGKMWLYEDDTRTYLTPKIHHSVPGGKDGADSREKTIQLLLRNTSECAVRNFATWWMDLTRAGWFNDQKLWDEMKRLEKLDRIFIDTPTPFRPEVACIVDEQSMMAIAAGGGTVSSLAVSRAREPLARMGAPYGQYLLDDFVSGTFDAKLNVFLAAWQFSAQQRQTLREKAAQPDKVNIWCYAPGFLDLERGGSTDSMTELTGFKFKRLENVQAWAEPTEAGRKLGLAEGVGVKRPFSPLFAVEDAKPEEILAVYPDGSAAVVMRTGKAGDVSIFVGPPLLNSSLLRLAANKADVHLFTEQDCNVYANGPVLVLHGAADGSVKLDFGKACRVTDLLDGSAVGHGPEFELPLKFGETRILRIENSR